MDYPAGTVLGIIRIELCFDLSGDCISCLIQNKRLGNWYGNSIVILVPVKLLLSKKF